jgi:hypothetical protein
MHSVIIYLILVDYESSNNNLNKCVFPQLNCFNQNNLLNNHQIGQNVHFYESSMVEGYNNYGSFRNFTSSSNLIQAENNIDVENN